MIARPNAPDERWILQLIDRSTGSDRIKICSPAARGPVGAIMPWCQRRALPAAFLCSFFRPCSLHCCCVRILPQFTVSRREKNSPLCHPVQSYSSRFEYRLGATHGKLDLAIRYSFIAFVRNRLAPVMRALRKGLEAQGEGPGFYLSHLRAFPFLHVVG